MEKALFLRARGRFSPHLILESKTFEPVFVENLEELPESLSEFKVIVIFSQDIDLKFIGYLHEKTTYRNIKILYFAEIITEDAYAKALETGADLVENADVSDENIVAALMQVHDFLQKSDHYNKSLALPFKESVSDVFSTMGMMQANLAESYLATTAFHYGHVTGMMALCGHEKGFIGVTFPEKLAKKIIARFLACHEEQLTDADMFDGVGEIINMIAGGAKARFENELFSLAAPFVIMGENYRVITQKELPTLILAYELEDDYFAVQISLMGLRH